MTTRDGVVTLLCQVDQHMTKVPKRPETKPYASESERLKKSEGSLRGVTLLCLACLAAAVWSASTSAEVQVSFM